MDSKFPQEDYIRLTDAAQQGDAAGAEAARKALIQRLKQEAKKIAEKYISPPHTTDFAIMFLPVEGLYSEALQTPELVEKRSGEVWLLLGEIKKDFIRFAETLENTRRRLDQAGESIDSAVTKSRSIQRKLSALETVPALDNPPETLTIQDDIDQ